jgi:DNA transposition AAA+ family ATPase
LVPGTARHVESHTYGSDGKTILSKSVIDSTVSGATSVNSNAAFETVAKETTTTVFGSQAGVIDTLTTKSYANKDTTDWFDYGKQEIFERSGIPTQTKIDGLRHRP